MLLLDFRDYTSREYIKKQRHNFTNKDITLSSSQNYGFSSSHVQMWELDHKEGWAQKNGCFWTVEKTLENPLDCKEIQPVNLKEICSEYSLEGLMLKLKLQLWPPDVKSQLIRKDWCWERLKAGGERDNRGWDGWKASPTQWTWFWASSGRCWRTGKPGMLQSMGSQRVRHDWATEQQQQVLNETQLPWAPRPSLRFISV